MGICRRLTSERNEDAGRAAIRGLLPLLVAAVFFATAGSARGAGPPAVEATWVAEVTSTSAKLWATINPEAVFPNSATYRFEYLTEAAYEANPPGDRFHGAALAPPSGAALLGSGTTPTPAVQLVGGLAPETVYYFRAVATNSGGTASGSTRFLATEEPTNVHPPIDGRGWEMVSPVDKGGGAIAAPGALFGGGEFQAAASSAAPALTYSSSAAFGEAAGAPPGSQYISRRGAGGWTTQNVSAPTESGGYGDEPDGVPYRVFSEDLGRALMLNPRRCPAGEPCPRGYSLRDDGTGAFAPLPAAAAGMRVFDASPDLSHIFFEEEGGAVWEWSGGGGLTPASPPPPNTGTERVSPDGLHRVFLTDAEIPPFDNIDANTGEPDTEVYLEGPPPGGGPSRVVCVSCNPTGERPHGSATIPGALVNGSTAVYRPRVLSASGNRVFFDSYDRLVGGDTSAAPDVYEWEAAGEGDCTRLPGCVGLISGGGHGSGGHAPGATFLDASADGSDVYFITEESLVGTDPGSIDVYDYRIGGGFPEPEPPFVCKADACQVLPGEPEDPSPGTLVENEGNPKQKYYAEHQRRCPKGKVRRRVKVKVKGKKGKKGKAKFKVRCVKKHRRKKHHGHKHRHGKRAGRRAGR